MAARNAGPFDEYVGMRRHLPVQHATFNAEGEAESNGIDWGDFGRMGFTQDKLNKGRHYEAPTWVMNYSQLRAVIVRYVELRAGLRRVQPGTDAERLKRAEASLAAQLPRKQALLTNLCKQFVALKRNGGDASCIRKLGEEIEGLDSALIINGSIAGKALRLATLYWRQGFHSVECASELNMKPPHCRMMLMRLRIVAHQLGLGAAPANNPGARKTRKPIASRVQRASVRPQRRPLPPPVCMVVKPPCAFCSNPLPKHRSRFCSNKCYRQAVYAEAKAARRAAARVAPLPTGQLRPPTAKRLAIVSGPEFIALFEAARKSMRDPNRTACVHGHPITAANAHVGDLKRTGRYACNECFKETMRRYVRNSAGITRRHPHAD